MKLNKTEARYVASEFAAHLLDRAVSRGDFDLWIRSVFGVAAEGQPASANNARRAALDLVSFLSRRSLRTIGDRKSAAIAFGELFPSEHTSDERVEMARELERYLSRAEVHAAARKEKETTETADARDAARAAVERGEMRSIDEVNCNPKPFPKPWPFKCICERCAKWTKYGCAFQQSPQQKTCAAYVEKDGAGCDVTP
jgi:hypothetical protein